MCVWVCVFVCLLFFYFLPFQILSSSNSLAHQPRFLSKSPDATDCWLAASGRNAFQRKGYACTNGLCHAVSRPVFDPCSCCLPLSAMQSISKSIQINPPQFDSIQFKFNTILFRPVQFSSMPFNKHFFNNGDKRATRVTSQI